MRRLLAGASLALVPFVALLGAAAPANATAQVAFEPTMEPTLISWPATRELTFRLRMTAGPRAERFTVEVTPPSWPPGEGFPGPAGSPILLNCSLALEGAGSLEQLRCAHADLPRDACVRGAIYTPAAVLSLPANSTATLVARASLGSAPFQGTDLRVTFLTYGGQSGIGIDERALQPAAPTLSGAFGVPIALSIRPAAPRRGRRVAIHGRTLPSLRGQAISLRAGRYGRRGFRLRTVARVRVDRRGRFGPVGWRPRRRGSYELLAVYRSQRRHLASDRSCPRFLRVR